VAVDEALTPCALYTRQSTKTEGDLTSCEVQREICARFAQARGLLALDERFDDDGKSGASLNRPALQRLLNGVRAGWVQAVVVHRLDRLSRRVLDASSLLEEFKERGVRLFVASMPELAGGAFETLVLNMLSSFAEFERDMTASRIADRRSGLVARGRRIAGVVPFGYSSDPRTKQLIPIESEATVVRELFELVAKGVLPSETARIAADKGWRTRSGGAWTARQVLDTLANPVYSGRFRTSGGTRPGIHEAIVSEDCFHLCADVVSRRRTGATGPRQRIRVHEARRPGGQRGLYAGLCRRARVAIHRNLLQRDRAGHEIGRDALAG
jgi:site-specific DNA recombinase